MTYSPFNHKPSRHLLWMLAAYFLGAVALSLTPVIVYANPEGGQVVAGSAVINRPNSTTVAISQASNKAIINWHSFSIRSDEKTTFMQPDARSIALNRVTGVDPSKIMGTLMANGRVWLVNPSGIVFGKTAKVNVAGLLATTLNISNRDFMAGNYKFHANSNTGAMVANAGHITINDIGLAALVAPGAENSGVIMAHLGKIQLASASGFTIDLSGDGTFNFLLDKQVTRQIIGADGSRPSAAVTNTGHLIADGGTILLTADTAKSIVDHAIDMQGYVNARSASTQNGIVVLNGGANGTVQVSGTIDASGKTLGQSGGIVEITGKKINLTSTAIVNVSGNIGGGTALIGGDLHGNGVIRHSSSTTIALGASINVDAISAGNGGKVVVWSDNTTEVHGSISAQGGQNRGDGGLIETSGHTLDISGAHVEAGAFKGKGGIWLLDPTNLTIDDPAAAVIDGALNSGTNSTISATNNVDITSNITKSSGDDATFLVNAYFIYQHEGTNLTSGSGKLNVDYEARDRIWIGRGRSGATANFATNGGNITFHGPNFVGIHGTIDAGAGNILIKAENKESSGVDKGIWLYKNTLLFGNKISTVTKSTLRKDKGVIEKHIAVSKTIDVTQQISESLDILGEIRTASAKISDIAGTDMRKLPKQIISKKIIKAVRGMITGTSKHEAGAISKVFKKFGPLMEIISLAVDTVDIATANNAGAFASSVNILMKDVSRAAGGEAGGEAGGATGGVIGTVVPGLGNFVGGVIGGVIGGITGGYLAGKAYDKWIAKTVVEVSAEIYRYHQASVLGI